MRSISVPSTSDYHTGHSPGRGVLRMANAFQSRQPDRVSLAWTHSLSLQTHQNEERGVAICALPNRFCRTRAALLPVVLSKIFLEMSCGIPHVLESTFPIAAFIRTQLAGCSRGTRPPEFDGRRPSSFRKCENETARPLLTGTDAQVSRSFYKTSRLKNIPRLDVGGVLDFSEKSISLSGRSVHWSQMYARWSGDAINLATFSTDFWQNVQFGCCFGEINFTAVSASSILIQPPLDQSNLTGFGVWTLPILAASLGLL